MAKKAAVVIGIDKTGNLAKLDSAAAGAEAVANWLKDEGYDVEFLSDKSGPVAAGDVETAIAKFVTLPPRYGLLVVYFSGHGYWHARADRWLLSGAPTKTSDAINLDGAMDLARYSGIPNVVFISDACRSIPDARTGMYVTGVDGFPNYAEISKTSKVDFFKATSEARSAYEGDIEGNRQSILTYALMSAYKEPEAHMIREVIEGTNHLKVVPNRELEDYLQDKVNAILETIDINLTQDIEANVSSGDDVYIASAHAPAPAAVRRTRRRRGASRGTRSALPARPTSAGRDAAEAIFRTLTGPGPTGDPDQPLAVSDPATEARLGARLPNETVDRIDTMVGLSVQGARVVRAISTKGEGEARVELLSEGDGGDTPAVIRLYDVSPAVSVVIQLEDGRGAVLAALEGYIGHARFDARGLSNVSYVPSSNHWRWPMYADKKEKIDRLRALVALAVEDNSFIIRSDEEADALGGKIRMEKGIDPTLGLYAAHAFSQAGKDDKIASVLHYMRSDLNADLFDVRALASRNLQQPWGDYPLAPFCPMLTQTWNLLRPRGIALPPALAKTIPYLDNALWTTFRPEVTDDIVQAIETGELK